MAKTITELDWSLVQAFLAVAEVGSLSGAARALEASQPTLGRQVRAIEDQLGLQLFQRQPRGLDLTEEGQALVGPARRMRDAVRDIALYAAGHDSELSGTVRITTSEMMAQYHLPAIIARLRRDLPEVQVELAPSDATENLLYREADIAVRMYRPEQLDVVARHLGDMEMGAFAARSYLDRRGTPRSAGELFEHELVGYDRSELILRGMREAGFEATRDWFATRCDMQTVYWELVRAGCGIGFGQRAVAAHDPQVVEIDLGFPIPPLPVWLAAHQGMRHTPRIKRVWDILAEGLGAVVS
ncbi:LysR family transcriptional regulator [Marimonas lutisalis]|uniref:LysR family transcriptional regulator n=1 Tax=Marimonas lutisalis TaxID=2545756 RepID=UPI0010F5C965|nr:LysR family transcriptional regulator [Marimonas lutisalis]